MTRPCAAVRTISRTTGGCTVHGKGHGLPARAHQHESNHGGAYSQLAVIRLYEAVIPGLHKYDPALYATPETPFAASVACGLSADGTAAPWTGP